MGRIHSILLTVATISVATSVYAAEYDIEYFLPAKNITFNQNVPSPKQYLGYDVAERFVDWGEILNYMQALEQASPRVSVRKFGTTYEHRRFIQVVITSEKNQARLEEIRQEHLSLTDASVSAALDIKKMPVVVNIGASVHGNEASGVNSMLPIAYYFAAGEDAVVREFLDNTILVLTPGLNPDGINRFANWVTVNSSLHPTSDPNAREHNEMAPSSRADHYWNDCNRDVLNLQYPEGRNGVEMYLYWMPNVLLDLHEQGSFKRGWYYFSPGDPRRTHGYISQENQDLTKMISVTTKAAFDSMQVKCFTERGYDDFYIGKFAAYGDVQGSVCLLHEATSTYGHFKNFEGQGDRDFAFTVRNQSVAATTLAMRSYALKDTLLSYMRNFYARTALAAASDPQAGYLFDTRGDRGTAFSFLKMLTGHQIKVYPVKGQENTYAVPFNQKAYWKIKCIFEDITSYQDSVFYDISTWTIPRAFNLNYSTVAKMPELGCVIESPQLPEGIIEGGISGEGYAFALNEYFAPKFMTAIQRKGVRINATAKGEMFIPVEGQKLSAQELFDAVSSAAAASAVNLRAVKSAAHYAKSVEVREPNTAIIVNTHATSGYQKQGQIWKLLDDTYDMNHSIVNLERLESPKCSLDRYSAIVCYGTMPRPDREKTPYDKLGKWVEAGGTLILYGTAASLSGYLGFGKFKHQTGVDANYSGAIFRADIVKGKSPLFWGYDQKTLDIFKVKDDTYRLPEEAEVLMRLSSRPYLSGCVSERNKEKLAGIPVVATMKAGKGHIVFIAEDIHFRSVWYGTSHILTNAIYFGDRL